MILNHSGALASPAAARHATTASSDIARAMLASRLVPVLGPGLSGSAPAPDPAAAAEHLSRALRLSCASTRGSLARVGQWVVRHARSRPAVRRAARALRGASSSPGPSTARWPRCRRSCALADCPCQLLLTSGFDRMLEQALSEAGEPYDVVSFVALGRDRGKFLHVAADGSARVIDEPNLEVGLAAGERTLILKLNGGTRRALGRVRDSYVVSEDDYIDYLSQSDASALLPVGLAAHIRRSHLLFVGYELDEWSLRVFLRRLWGEERIAYRSWAIDAEPQPLHRGAVAPARRRRAGGRPPTPRSRSCAAGSPSEPVAEPAA